MLKLFAGTLVVLSLAAIGANAAETGTKTMPESSIYRLGRIIDRCTIMSGTTTIAICQAAAAEITTEWRTNPLTTPDIPVLSAVSLVKRAFLCVSPFWRDALSGQRAFAASLAL
jgi:hypothetical protein